MITPAAVGEIEKTGHTAGTWPVDGGGRYEPAFSLIDSLAFVLGWER